MSVKYTIFAIATVFLFANSMIGAVDTRAIDEVRNKGVLDNKDLKVIDEFIAEAIDELVATRDFATIADIRATILSRRGEQRQYAEQFFESSYKYLYAALKGASKLPQGGYRYETIVNLLILLDGMEDVRLIELAVDMLKDEHATVRYWAVHSVANAGVMEQLTSAEAGDMKLARRIAEELKGIADGSSVEILSLMVDFSSGVKIRESESLLLQIADKRIKEYAGWTVEYELLDSKILKLLSIKMNPEDNVNVAVARRFSQLYSYVFQRYVKGREVLKKKQKQQLASVLAEVEKSCISKLLGIPQSVIKKAIEGNSYVGLLHEHSRLLGDATRPGALGMKFGFDYGTGPDGSKLIEPVSLSGPPN